MDRNCVLDSTSNPVLLNQHVISYLGKSMTLSADQSMQVSKNITASAIILEMNDCLQRYYFRPYGLSNSLLTGAFFYRSYWRIEEYFENPTVLFILAFLRKYLTRGGITLYRQKEIAGEFFSTIELQFLCHCPLKQRSTESLRPAFSSIKHSSQLTRS
ncbi:hypothetical protein A4D02_14085 [Niastella koreensis]|uniref:Uncharacterized protein n=2 Tax=Niastella koreensis TaxID=354356 RepID=G8TRF6_NIAKG|nr:hypothetical protein [Niastella koreensis]AEW01087.1 hypothetical protein Niako_4839 [Niastella koreensis GR20-10]OQP41806.1 hypothetical protein A4D02_14085 [Niastella koreensis]